MADLAELKEQLRLAQFDLYFAKQVNWGNPNGGMIDYSNQLALIGQLQLRIQRAEQGGD